MSPCPKALQDRLAHSCRGQIPELVCHQRWSCHHIVEQHHELLVLMESAAIPSTSWGLHRSSFEILLCLCHWDWLSLRCFIPRCNHQDKHLYQGSKVEQSLKVANGDLAWMFYIDKVCFCNHDYSTSTLSVNSWIGLVNFVDLPSAILETCWEIQKNNGYSI